MTLKALLTWKVWLGMLATAAGLLAVSLLVILAGRPASRPDHDPARAALTVIAAFTSTPVASAPLPTVTPTAIPSTPTPPPDAFGIGVYVQITGTGGDGLRLRAGPGLSEAQLFLGYDSEVYQIVDGPFQADGYTWWKLTAPYDATRTGWAVQDYLTVIPSP